MKSAVLQTTDFAVAMEKLTVNDITRNPYEDFVGSNIISKSAMWAGAKIPGHKPES